MKIYRHEIFETNSSTTHALVITSKNSLEKLQNNGYWRGILPGDCDEFVLVKINDKDVYSIKELLTKLYKEINRPYFEDWVLGIPPQDIKVTFYRIYEFLKRKQITEDMLYDALSYGEDSFKELYSMFDYKPTVFVCELETESEDRIITKFKLDFFSHLEYFVGKVLGKGKLFYSHGEIFDDRIREIDLNKEFVYEVILQS